MTKTAYVKARIEPDLKMRVEDVFSQLGISTSEAICMFYRSVDRERGIPFKLKIPNKETVEAMEEALDAGKVMESYSSVKEMRKALLSDDV